MYTFSGWYEHTVDTKGRVSIPASFRDKLAANHETSLFATRSLSGKCVEVFPASEWQRLLERVAGLSQVDPTVIAFRRRFISAATELMVDGSGRVLVPPAVRTKLGIEREVMITGNIEHMEIWDRDTFAGVADGDDGIAVLEGMSKLGF
jgi:MraZ protein